MNIIQKFRRSADPVMNCIFTVEKQFEQYLEFYGPEYPYKLNPDTDIGKKKELKKARKTAQKRLAIMQFIYAKTGRKSIFKKLKDLKRREKIVVNK